MSRRSAAANVSWLFAANIQASLMNGQDIADKPHEADRWHEEVGLMKGFGVGQKLGAGITIMICLLLLQGYASIAVLGTLSSTLDRSARMASESSALVNGIRTDVAEMKNFGKMTQFAYAINVKLDQKAASDCLLCHTLPNPDTAQREFATLAAGVHSKLQTLAATGGLSAEEKQPLDRVDKSTTEWSAVFGEFLAKASARQFVEAHSTTVDRMEPIRERVAKETNEVEAVASRSLARSQAETAAAVKQRIILLLGLQAVIILPMIFFAWRFIRRLVASLRALGEAARYLAAGDADGALRQLTAGGL
jgi:nitrogen fixation/metabolism regulation signal transduction histidine kinase